MRATRPIPTLSRLVLVLASLGLLTAPAPAQETTGAPTPGAVDRDGDGLIDQAEASAFYREHFDELDVDRDGRLSPAERAGGEAMLLDLELDPALDLERDAFESERLRTFNLRADHTTGMMSTRDFDEMVGTSDPAISDPANQLR